MKAMAFSCMKMESSSISVSTTTPNTTREQLIIKISLFKKTLKASLPSFHGITTMKDAL